MSKTVVHRTSSLSVKDFSPITKWTRPNRFRRNFNESKYKIWDNRSNFLYPVCSSQLQIQVRRNVTSNTRSERIYDDKSSKESSSVVWVEHTNKCKEKDEHRTGNIEANTKCCHIKFKVWSYKKVDNSHSARSWVPDPITAENKDLFLGNLKTSP